MSSPGDRRVLVLDDDEDFGTLLQLTLEAMLGVRCVVVHSFADLVAHAGDVLKCDAGVLDVNLGPRQPTGLDALDWLRANGWDGSAIFVTGHAATHPVLDGLVGSSDVCVLEKPVETEKLLSLLESREVARGAARASS
jgi:DNA-binding response OmpR family regulator